MKVESCTSFGDMKIITEIRSLSNTEIFKWFMAVIGEQLPDHRNADTLEITNS